MGTSLDDTIVTLTEVASQAISATKVDNGDSFTFEYVVDLPSIVVEDRGDLKIEVFAVDPSVGVSGFHMCQVVVEAQGSELEAAQVDPVYQWDHTKMVPIVSVGRGGVGKSL